MRENLHMGLGRNAIPTFLQYLVTSIKTQELEIKKGRLHVCDSFMRLKNPDSFPTCLEPSRYFANVKPRSVNEASLLS